MSVRDFWLSEEVLMTWVRQGYFWLGYQDKDMVLGCYGRRLVIYWQVDGWARGGSRSVTSSCFNLPSLPVP